MLGRRRKGLNTVEMERGTVSPPLLLGARPRRTLLVLLLAILQPCIRQTPTTAAATLSFTVTTTADAPDANPGDGVCATSARQCSLRAAVQQANALPLGSTSVVILPAGAYGLSLGPLAALSNTVAISGTDARTTIINGRGSQVLTVANGARVELSRVALTGGKSSRNGGAINNAGTLILWRSSVVLNAATGFGGGIFNATGGSVVLRDSLVASNTAQYGGGIENQGNALLDTSVLSNNTANATGGAIQNDGGAVLLSRSTAYSNTAAFGGGGMENYSGTLAVQASTIGNNTAFGGGGIENYGAATLSNSTLVSNTASTGGGISNSGSVQMRYDTVTSNSSGLNSLQWTGLGSSLSLTGTIVANSTAGPNCSGPIGEFQGYNLDSSASCGFKQTTDLTNTNPLLGSLAYNGGPTPTIALLPGSPAINHGGVVATGCPATDQRGAHRTPGLACDIGAYEAAP